LATSFALGRPSSGQNTCKILNVILILYLHTKS
jgi:hypothetical protein